MLVGAGYIGGSGGCVVIVVVVDRTVSALSSQGCLVSHGRATAQHYVQGLWFFSGTSLLDCTVTLVRGGRGIRICTCHVCRW